MDIAAFNITKSRKRFAKEHLEDGKLFLNTVLEENTQQTRIQLVWVLENYSELKKDVFYYQSTGCSAYKWCVQMAKVKETLCIILSTNFVKKEVDIAIDNADSALIRKSKPKEISEGVHVSEFCNKVIMDPQCGCLCGDALSVMFQHDTNLVEFALIDMFYIKQVVEFPFVQERCINFLKTNLSPENMIHIYAAAELYEVEELKKDAVKFMWKEPDVASYEKLRDIKEEMREIIKNDIKLDNKYKFFNC